MWVREIDFGFLMRMIDVKCVKRVDVSGKMG